VGKTRAVLEAGSQNIRLNSCPFARGNQLSASGIRQGKYLGGIQSAHYLDLGPRNRGSEFGHNIETLGHRIQFVEN